MFPKAIKFARQAHSKQTRADGTPYVMHPMRVAELFDKEIVKIAAVLHDVLEDTDVKVEELEKEFGVDVAEAIVTLTRKKDEDYVDYIDRIIATNDYELAEIKLYDILDNTMDNPTEKQLAKYDKVFDELNDAVANKYAL